jgi:hypothetical protein
MAEMDQELLTVNNLEDIERKLGANPFLGWTFAQKK